MQTVLRGWFVVRSIFGSNFFLRLSVMRFLHIIQYLPIDNLLSLRNIWHNEGAE